MKLEVFKNEEFGSIRTLTIDNEPWFIGSDLANVLGYSNPQKSIRDHVEPEDKRTERIVHPSGGAQQTIIINESGLYSLVLSSKLPNAKKFKQWVTKEVLPSIRKNGAYIQGQEKMSDEDLIAKALIAANNIIENKNKEIAALKPKALFADSVSGSSQTILIGALAKMIKQNGHDIGQNRLFEWMRVNGYLINQKGKNFNMPTQRSMDLGLFRVKETAITHSDGHVTLSRTPLVTGKGQQYFINKFLGE